MKKINLNKRTRKRWKRIISFTMAVVMCLEVLPLTDLGGDLNIVSRTAYAYDSSTSETINIGTVAEFVKYANEYENGQHNPNDTLMITFGSDSTYGEFKNGSQTYKSIGSTRPFNGKIIIQETPIFTLPCAMFDTITDDVEIVDNTGNETTVCLARTARTVDEPLFAKHVQKSRTSGETVEWNFKYTGFKETADDTNSYVFDFAGYIGVLGDDLNGGAKVKIGKITHDNLGTNGIANVSATGDAGLVCCTVKAGSELEIGEIEVTINGTTYNAENNRSSGSYTVKSTSSGNAGGLVGSMGVGSTLTLGTALVNHQNSGMDISVTDGYAGGIVGFCDDGSITYNNSAAYTVTQKLTGTNGAGGIAGYYKASSGGTISTANVSIASGCKVNGAGNCGGLFGELVNGGTMTLSAATAVTSDHNGGVAANLGGLVGKYTASALSNTLTVDSSAIITMTRSAGSADYYGGAIGYLDSADTTNTHSAYVKFNGITVSAGGIGGVTENGYFGGLVGGSPYSFVDIASTNVISYSGISGARNFGGVVGDLSEGVLRLDGTTNLSGAADSSTYTAKSGQIVGYRDCGLVYAESDWTLTRPSSARLLDDVGSWGEVLNCGDKLTLSKLFTNNSTIGTDHYVTLADAVTTIKDKDDFAKTALNIQLNKGQSTGVLQCSSDSTSATLLASDSLQLEKNTTNIELDGTGITGFTRDNGADADTAFLTFFGKFDGNGGTIKLAVGNGNYNNYIYRHKYNGLFAKTSGTTTTVEDLIISGSSVINTRELAGGMNVGNIIAKASGGLTLSNVTISSGATINHAGTTNSYNIGGLIGDVTSAGTVTISGCEYSGTITGDSSNKDNGSGANIGGLIGLVDSNTFTINLTDTDLKGTVASTHTRTEHHIGGAIGVIKTNANASSGRKVNITNLKTDGLSVSANGDCGGLLGYGWYKTDVEFVTSNGLKVGSTTVPTITNIGTSAAGLCLIATGYWKVNTGGIDIDGITVTANSATSFGLIINQGYYKQKDETWGDPSSTLSSAIYLELAPNAFTVEGDTLTLTPATVAVFDELVAYTGPDNNVLANGQGVISVATASHALLKMDDSNTGVTYQHKTAFAGTNASKQYNPHSRYYYNLDSYRTSPSGNEQNFLMWSVKEYAHPSIKDYFSSSYTDTIGSASTDVFNMRGYSYYPVDINSGKSITIKGKYSLYNTEFNTTESGSGDKRSSLDNTTQHYAMHNALFRNVNGSLTVQDTELYGKVNVDYTDTGAGALVMGTVWSDASGSPATVTIKSLKLAGIEVDNLGATKHSGSGTYTYAPLLINKAGSNATITFKNDTAGTPSIENTSAYSSMGAGATTPTYIASSLLGKMGSTSVQKLRLSFEDIKLDGRNSTGVTNLSGLTTTYNSKGCLFKEAILLEELCYGDNSGSQGTYNFTYEVDWNDSGTDPRCVTYGYEIEGSVENSNAQHWYKDSWASSTTQRFVRPDDKASVGSQYTAFSTQFMKYVKPYSGETTGYKSAENTHELRVNIKASTFSGCGTYNDPYIITAPGDFDTVEEIIESGYSLGGATIRVPDGVTNSSHTTTWCSNQTDASGHYLYTSTSNNGYESIWSNPTNATTLTGDTLAQYLAGAYYKIDASADITIPSSFTGLSDDVDEPYVFRGVIDGSGNTIKTQSAYPLISSSNGSVVYNLTIDVQPTAGRKLTETSSLPFKSEGVFNSERCEYYGAVIGQILGGDNIIDSVSVKFTGKIIDANGKSKAQLVPIGGYVGVIVNGGLIFRGMTGTAANNQAGISASNLNNFSGGTGDVTASTNKKWLYVNPIIGRVINGYAITESDAYRPFEDGIRTYGDGSKVYWHETKDGSGNVTGTYADNNAANKVGVTMRNGTKNYSITDIKNYQLLDEEVAANSSVKNKLEVSSGRAITAPDAQAFFLMSVMVNSGMSCQDNGQEGSGTQAGIIGYYGDYQMVRHSTYEHIGDSTVSDAYTKAATDGSGKTVTPHLIKAYNKVVVSSNKNYYYAKIMAKGTETSTITLSDNSYYYLPDGYKGIGNIYHDPAYKINNTYPDTNLFLYIRTFSGSGSTISQNTSFDYYITDYADYLPVRNKNSDNDTGKTYTPSSQGVGLINLQPYKDTNYNTFSNLYLTGNVKSYVYNYSGVYNSLKSSSNDLTYILSAGLLFGVLGNNQTLNNVVITNADCFSCRNTGGLIGLASRDTKNAITINYTINSIGYDSDKIISSGICSTGGLVGKLNAGYAKVDMNNHTFNLTKVECIATERGGNDYDFGVGGFIGMLRAGQNGETNEANYFKNIIIGTESRTQVVKCNDGASIYTAGVVGIMNKTKGVWINNCTFYNLSVESNDVAAGLVAYPTTWSPVYATNVRLLSPKGSTIEGTTVGGFIGSSNNSKASNNNGDGSRNFRIKNCSIDGYTISGNESAGGLIGYRGAYTDCILELDNFNINNCTIKSDSMAGGLAGELVEPLYGYNILSEGITVTSITDGKSISKGYICGKNNNTGSNGVIKLAGFSRQGTVSVDKMVGNSSSASSESYGTGGYVVFADYKNASNKQTGTDAEDNPVYANRQALFSNVLASGSKTNVAYIDRIVEGSTVSDNWPYVSSSPKTDISNTQYLTGDGAHDSSYVGSTAKTILDDMNSAKNKRYQNTGFAYSTTEGSDYVNLRDFLTGGMSSFTRQTKTGYTGTDFPILVVSNINCNAVLTNYLRLLSNTNFNYGTDDTGNVFNVDISSWKYEGGVFTQRTGEGVEPALRRNPATKGFYITSSEFDNTDYQFSLIDVQYLDPSDTSKIAYHLYVPVVVKKMLHYNVNIRMSSGTTYDPDTYPSSVYNIAENLGNPVTIKASFVYIRDKDEWTAAINEGESVYRNYDGSRKYLMFTPSATLFPEGAEIVLLDRNGDKDKSYYGKFAAATNTAGEGQDPVYSYTNGLMEPAGDGIYKLKLSSFDGFAVCKLNDMMTISLDSEATEKNLVIDNSAPDNKVVAVINDGSGNNGDKLRVAEAGDSEGSKVAIKVTSLQDGKSNIEETYYLSIFTKSSTTTNIYHYQINGVSDFGEQAYPSARTNNEAPHLFLGNIYSNTLTLSETNENDEMSKTNTAIGADLVAKVGFTPSAIDAGITGFLGNPNVQIFQTFLVSLNMVEKDGNTITNKRGIQIDPACVASGYKLTGRNASGIEGVLDNNDSHLLGCRVSGSYVEILNDKNLKNDLINAARHPIINGEERDYTVQIESSISLTYDPTMMSVQFPKASRGDGVGTYMIGYSNISSLSTNATASRASVNTETIQTEKSEPLYRYLYFMSEITSVDFSYKAIENDDYLAPNGKYYPAAGKNGNYGQLGIDANQLEGNDTTMHIDTAAYYDASGYSLKSRGHYLKVVVQLSKKADYSQALYIPTYLNNFELYDKDDDDISSTDAERDITVTKPAEASEDYLYTYIIPIEELDGENDSYVIPISFDVYTGANSGFESKAGKDMQYSNYRVTVTVGMLETSTGSYLTNSDATDWVVYTNARLISDVIETN